MTVDACLLAVGTAVAAVSPIALVRPALVAAQPRLAVVTWLATAGSVMVSWLVAGLMLALGHHQVPARLLGAVVVLTLVGRLVWCAGTTWHSTRERRAMHRRAVAILGQPDSSLDALVLDSAEPLAYCLPGRSGTVVVTTGACRLLTRAQLRAVLAHERAHLDGRHHLLVSLGLTLGRSAPRLGIFRHLRSNVAQLVELIADDVAARRHGKEAVAGALLAMGTAETPSWALGVAGTSVMPRALRLSMQHSKRPSRLVRLRLVVIASALIIGPYLTILVPCPHPW